MTQAEKNYGGGSDGYGVRLWKLELQKLADEIKLPIAVCHLPPVTSKCKKIEHRLFSSIIINWRGKPPRSYRKIVQLIAATATDIGLKARAELNKKRALRLPTQRWPSTSRATHSIATGTARLHLATKSSGKHTLTELFMADP